MGPFCLAKAALLTPMWTCVFFQFNSVHPLESVSPSVTFTGSLNGRANLFSEKVKSELAVHSCNWVNLQLWPVLDSTLVLLVSFQFQCVQLSLFHLKRYKGGRLGAFTKRKSTLENSFLPFKLSFLSSPSLAQAMNSIYIHCTVKQAHKAWSKGCMYVR